MDHCHPPPLRYRAGVDARSVACGDAAARALRPRRCVREGGGGNTRVLRQWTRSPPLGWGHGANNFVTLLGNGTLGNVTLAVRAMIETPEAGYPPPAPPYVMVGLNGGGGGLSRLSSPRQYYAEAVNADNIWFNATHWGCAIAGAPAVCAAAHPVAFGLDAWHAVTLGESRGRIFATLDGATLFNESSPGRTNGTGGYLLLRTGAHRAQWDDLEMTLSE